MQEVRGILQMIISEKQIMQLMQLATAYTELLSIIESSGHKVNNSLIIREGIANLYREICGQQSEELKEIREFTNE